MLCMQGTVNAHAYAIWLSVCVTAPGGGGGGGVK